MAQLWLSCFTVFGGMILITFIISTFTAMPGDDVEARHWFVTNLQYVLLFFLVVAPLLALSISLGTRFNGAAAYAVTIGLALYGLFGIGYLEIFLADNDNPVLNLVYLLSPHYHLSDLTSRLVFKLGASPMGRTRTNRHLSRRARPRHDRGTLLPILPRRKMTMNPRDHTPILLGIAGLALAAVGLAGLRTNPVLRHSQNPLAVQGSAYGKLLARLSETTIDRVWHLGVEQIVPHYMSGTAHDEHEST